LGTERRENLGGGEGYKPRDIGPKKSSMGQPIVVGCFKRRIGLPRWAALGEEFNSSKKRRRIPFLRPKHRKKKCRSTCVLTPDKDNLCIFYILARILFF
jgi:hypothetical protein